MKLGNLLLMLILFLCLSCAKLPVGKSTRGTAVLQIILIGNADSDDKTPDMIIYDYSIMRVNNKYHENAVQINLNSTDAAVFADLTDRNIKKYLLIQSADEEILSAMIMEKIPDGKILISVRSREEADRIYRLLIEQK